MRQALCTSSGNSCYRHGKQKTDYVIINNSSLERFSHWVKKWGTGDMKKRWLSHAIFQSEERMHCIRGFMEIKPLVENMKKILSEEKN